MLNPGRKISYIPYYFYYSNNRTNKERSCTAEGIQPITLHYCSTTIATKQHCVVTAQHYGQCLLCSTYVINNIQAMFLAS